MKNGKELSGSHNELSFEEAFGKLGEMVQTLEKGDLTLEQATQLYEEGMELAKKCNELLSSSELRVKKIQESFGEQMQLLNSRAPSDTLVSSLDLDTSDEQN